MDAIERFPILRLTREGGSKIEKAVAREFPLTIILNDRELVTLLCSPADLRYLAVGFLASEGFINSKDEVNGITMDERRGVVRVETAKTKELAEELIFKRVISSGCGRGASFYSTADAGNQKVDSQMKMSAEAIITQVKIFQHSSDLYLTTHGVHSAALFDGKSILVFSEDIGRHNVIDKIFGKCILEDIPTRDRAVITTGRITSEILHKVAKRGVPIIISISEPTDLGVRIADTLGITLIASVRGKKMNIYTGAWRLENSGK
ncbi:formate dehydrogenase accessory sulfurtransferase FdhD [Chloroflexota bacterium]